ncbi:MAG: glucose-6-phosphate dehydrogenase assembly protein OpcA [Chloroflexota bacterium]
MSVSAESSGVSLASVETAAHGRAIEAGLHELWRQADAGEIGGALVRAASVTLIVPVLPDQSMDALVEAVDRVTLVHPCRAVFVVLTDAVTEPSAILSSHYRRASHEEAARYWEEIRIVAPLGAVHQAMSAASTVVLPGLPVQTWWPGAVTFDGDLYNHIVEVSDRVLLDSRRSRDPRASLAALAGAIDVAHESIAFGDLSWSRINPWRVMVAELFDAPADQDMLDSIERVVIEYTGSPDANESVKALMFVGWLASRLGWEPRAALEEVPGTWRFWLVDGVRPVEVRIVRNDRPLSGDISAPAGLRSVTIEAAEGDRRALYLVERSGAGDEARTVKNDGTMLEGHMHLPVMDEVELLQEELGGFTTDRIFVDSLELVVALLAEGRR